LTAVVWVAGLVVMTAIIVAGVLLAVLWTDPDYKAHRRAKEQVAKLTAENQELRVQVQRLTSELQREKDKIHHADE
jgi:Flp pilus assembly protein TadB